MNSAMRIVVQALTALGFIALIAALGQGPAFAPVPEGHGELKISVAHLAARLQPCRQLSEQERLALPPTRRVTEVCERGRAPTRIHLVMNGETLIDRLIAPAGMHGDGRAYFLQFLPLPAGHYELELVLHDSAHNRPDAGDDRSGYTLSERFVLELAPGESALLAIGDGTISLRQSPEDPS
ncbi:MAG: hypothetical protein ACNA7J_03610 [Wenzhouxiangella sp.]